MVRYTQFQFPCHNGCVHDFTDFIVEQCKSVGDVIITFFEKKSDS